MKILITGGRGFVGGRLVKRLRAAGHQVFVGSRQPSVSGPKEDFRITDWGHTSGLQEACRGIDLVIHTAGMNALQCALDYSAAMKVNGELTANLLEAAIAEGVQKFIFLSTIHVYSSNLAGTISENAPAINSHPYAVSNRRGELAVMAANDRDEFNGIILRLSNGFGAPVTADANCWMLLVNDLCRQAVENGVLRLQSSGTELRDFITLTSVCNSINTLVTRLEDATPSSPVKGIYNLGSGSSMSILEMAELVRARCGAVMGFWPEIIRQEGGDQPSPAFKYENIKLEQLVGRQDASFESEIDQLLVFCKQHFQSKIGVS